MELKAFVVRFRDKAGQQLLEAHVRAPTQLHAVVAAGSYVTYEGGPGVRWFDCSVEERGGETQPWHILRGDLPVDDRKAVEGMEQVVVDRIIRP